jgi:Type IV secretory system Conjugative DNA transfer
MSELLDLVGKLESQHRAIPLGATNGERVFAKTEECVTVIGPPRSGKTSSIFIPAVALHPGPVVVTSTRTDLRDATLTARRAIAEEWGGDVYELVLDEAIALAPRAIPVAWDLAMGCEVWNVAQDRAASLIAASMTGKDDGHWRGTGQKLLAATLFAGRRNGLSDREIARKLDARDTADMAAYLWEESEHDEECMNASFTLQSILGEGAAAPDELASIFSTLTSRTLAGLRYTRFAGAIELEPIEILSSYSTLYITVRDQRARHMASLIAAFIEMLAAEWRTLSTAEKPNSLLLALDEVTNVAPAQSLPTIVTAGGGDKLQVLLGFQDPQQAGRWHDEDGVSQDRILLNATSHTVIFPGLADYNFLEGQTRLYGKSVKHDQHIRVSLEVTNSPQYATPARLIEERSRLEERMLGLAGTWRNHMATVVALQEATKIWAERIQMGIKPRFKDPGGARGVLDEVLTYTSTELRTERRDSLEPAELFRGQSERTVFVRSGNQGESREMLRHYEDPVWNRIL